MVKLNRQKAIKASPFSTQPRDRLTRTTQTPAPNFSASKLTTDVGTVAAKLFAIRKEQQEEQVNRFRINVPSGLPWKPKACHRNVELFFSVVRRKFIGYAYNGWVLLLVAAAAVCFKVSTSSYARVFCC